MLAWMIAGLVGIAIGWLALIFAPGQAFRYNALADPGDRARAHRRIAAPTAMRGSSSTRCTRTSAGRCALARARRHRAAAGRRAGGVARAPARGGGRARRGGARGGHAARLAERRRATRVRVVRARDDRDRELGHRAARARLVAARVRGDGRGRARVRVRPLRCSRCTRSAASSTIAWPRSSPRRRTRPSSKCSRDTVPRKTRWFLGDDFVSAQRAAIRRRHDFGVGHIDLAQSGV